MKKHWIVFVVTVAVLLVLDLWLKSWASGNLCCCERHLYDGNVVLIPGVLGLTYFRNTGALWGFLSGWDGARWLLAALKVVILGGLVWYYHRLPRENKFWAMRVPLILIFAGGAGNLFDRVAFGYVRDMIQFIFVNFPIWNLADAYVTVGVFGLVFVGFFVIKDFPFP
ncbi:MAG: signal peptidase II [Defluviitaleaceae bacterium]|nr:signal peptidase II [Defluviitaleaceae bacterium]